MPILEHRGLLKPGQLSHWLRTAARRLGLLEHHEVRCNHCGVTHPLGPQDTSLLAFMMANGDGWYHPWPQDVHSTVTQHVVLCPSCAANDAVCFQHTGFVRLACEQCRRVEFFDATRGEEDPALVSQGRATESGWLVIDFPSEEPPKRRAWCCNHYCHTKGEAFLATLSVNPNQPKKEDPTP